MAGLANLIALQKAQKAGVTTDAPTATRTDVRAEDATVQQADLPSDSNASGPVHGEEVAAEAAGTTPAKPLGLGLNRLGALTARANSAKPSGSIRESGSGESVPAELDTGVDGPAEFSLDDIAELDEQSTPVVERDGSGFDDEIEATAPDRDLPADLEPGMMGFVEQLDNIYQVLNDPDMFAQSVRILMMELQENPEYEKLVSDQDVHTMIRAMRNTMGLAKIKKQEKSRKAKGTTAAKKKGAVTDDVMGVLDALGFEDE